MLLDQAANMTNIIAAQIIKVFYPFVIAQDWDGGLLKIEFIHQWTTRSTSGMSSVALQAKLWVPIGKHYHQLLDNGWLAESTS